MRNLSPIATVTARTIGLLAVLLLSLCWDPVPAVAQSGPVVWSRPINLSNSPQASAHSTTVADDYGLVHVFWSEEVDGRPVTPEEGILNTGNSIMYTRWDGQSWSTPLDVLVLPGETRAEWPVVTIDAQNRLHLVWQSMTAVYYASASSWEADSAHNWTEPVALTSYGAFEPSGASITADLQGTLHAVYAATDDEEGVNYTRSIDGGEIWALPVSLYRPVVPSETPPSMVQIVSDDAGRLHVVWQTNRLEGSGYGVWYSRSSDAGETWIAPIQLADRDPGDFSVSTPYLMFDSTSALHLIYVDGPYTGSKGRFHRISRDGGATWSEPKHIITELVGINGPVMPVVDGAGQMHLIANMRTEVGQVVGIYYARWEGSGWSPLVPVEVSVPKIHYVATTVRLGNELHITYTGIEGGEIWHVRGDVSRVTPQPLRTPPTPALPADPTLATETAPPTAVLLPGTAASPSVDETLPRETTAATVHPLVPSIALAFTIVSAALAWARIHSR